MLTRKHIRKVAQLLDQTGRKRPRMQLREAMSNLRPDDTGVDNVIIWVSSGEFSGKESVHGPRIKVMSGNKLTPEALEKAVSVRLTNPPEVLGKLSGNAKKQVVAFIEANRDTLLSYWNFEIGTPSMSDMSKKVADRFFRAMAYDREGFKDKVEEYIGGALLEFYKARLASKNGQTKWVQHWMTEVRTLLDRSLVQATKHTIRGFKDRQKAIDETTAYLKLKDSSYRRTAETTIKRDYNLAKLKYHLDDTDTASFWSRVEIAIQSGLE